MTKVQNKSDLPQDPEHGLGYLDRESPMPLPRSFETSKAWATEPLRRDIPVYTGTTKKAK